MTFNQEQFDNVSLAVGLTGLMGYMAFIVYDLAKQSNAGKFGTFVLFLSLGLGVIGFLIKTVIAEILQR